MLLDQLGVVGLKSVLASPAPHDEPHLCGSRLAEGQQGHEPLSPAQEPFSTASAMSSHRIRYSATAAPIGNRHAGAYSMTSPAYSITSSARWSIDCGTVRPSASAVLRLMTNSKVVGCWTGRSAGLAPLR